MKNPMEAMRQLGYASLIAANLERLKAFNYKLSKGRDVNSLDQGDWTLACLSESMRLNGTRIAV